MLYSYLVLVLGVIWQQRSNDLTTKAPPYEVYLPSPDRTIEIRDRGRERWEVLGEPPQGDTVARAGCPRRS